MMNTVKDCNKCVFKLVLCVSDIKVTGVADASTIGTGTKSE